ncbi:MAG: hypothetical protein RL885_29010 [Planctomycetota bacterium]
MTFRLMTLASAALLALPWPARAAQEAEDPFEAFQDAPPREEAIDQEEPDPEAEEEARQRQIDKNYNETIGIYRGVLENDHIEVQNLERRIAANEKLLSDYRERRARAEEERRQLNLGFDRQVLELREAAGRGELQGELLEGLLEQKRRDRGLRDEELRSDIAFYSQEIDRLGGLSRELRGRLQILSLTNRFGAKPPSAPEDDEPEPPSLFDQLEQKYQRVSAFRPSPLMWHALDVEPWASRLRGQAPRQEP